VTEQLLEQLSAMDSAQEEGRPPVDVATPAHNPFSETFDSEEIVLDQYATFESLLLAEAPRVENRTDTAFAQQLQQLETVETPVASPQSNVLVDKVRDKVEIETEEASTTAFHTDEPGDVLVIEEDDQPQTTIVEGQKFRQLFSSLETEGECCFN